MALLTVSHLRVSLGHPPTAVVKDVSFTLSAGETLAIVGESGSGKSISLLTAIGLQPRDALVSGSVRLEDREILGLSAAQLRRLRGKRIGYISQDPLSNLHPQKSVGKQLEEAITSHQRIGKKALRQRVLALLNEVGIRNADARYHDYPHQFSGGMRQRVIIAIAIALEPAVIIADEPTTALDVTVQAAILTLLKNLQRQHGCALIFISHDLGVVSEIADRVMVMQHGRVVETNSRENIYHHPQHDHTRALLNAGFHQPLAQDSHRQHNPVLLAARGLSRRFAAKRLWWKRPSFKPVLKDISFSIHRGEILGLVGESGSGKTTLGRIIAGLEYADRGEIDFAAQAWQLRPPQLPNLNPESRAAVQVIFQDPYSSLNPRRSIGQILRDPLMIASHLHGEKVVGSAQLAVQVNDLLAQVELPADIAERYPNQLSGGQRQRVAIARALAMRPKLIVADEAVSALDITTQYKIVQLLATLRERNGLSLLFISHDLSVVAALCDRILVLEGGEIVEQGSREEVFYRPQHDYTRRLVNAIPGKPFLQQASA